MKYQILVERRGFYVSSWESRERFETAATLSTEEIGKYALNGILGHKAFFEARVRLKDKIDSEKKESPIPKIPLFQRP